jgi:hypothetical protein
VTVTSFDGRERPMFRVIVTIYVVEVDESPKSWPLPSLDPSEGGSTWVG